VKHIVLFKKNDKRSQVAQIKFTLPSESVTQKRTYDRMVTMGFYEECTRCSLVGEYNDYLTGLKECRGVALSKHLRRNIRTYVKPISCIIEKCCCKAGELTSSHIVDGEKILLNIRIYVTKFDIPFSRLKNQLGHLFPESRRYSQRIRSAELHKILASVFEMAQDSHS